MTRRSEPVRTCVGCRQRAAKSELVRVVVVGAVLQPDPGGKLPGRGAHLHPDPDCLDLAVRRRGFVRALRLHTNPDPAAVAEHLAHRRAQHHSDQTQSAERADRRDDCAMSTNS